uniref:PX domain-containing protein n=1 Tax=Kalanchoe fedtschenkoi TaxID=63787 RepID=A0A7N0TFM7_KALFE
MGMYSRDLSLFDFNYTDPNVFASFTRHSQLFSSTDSTDTALDVGEDSAQKRQHENKQQLVLASRNPSPPRYRHDGTSPLPLGMDWSLPPRKWEGKDTVWPGDSSTGWSYCVTIPSWTLLPKARSSETVVFFGIIIGLQSPERITTTRSVLRRFRDFLKLYSDLKKAFPKKNIPPAPPKKLLRRRSKMLLEERRCLLEDWMEKLLSDIDISRCAPTAEFLELEAAARSSFYDADQAFLNAPSTSGVDFMMQFRSISDVSAFGNSSEFYDESTYGASEPDTPRQEQKENSTSTVEQSISDQVTADTSGVSKMTKDKSLKQIADMRRKEILLETGAGNLPSLGRGLSTDSSIGSFLSSVGGVESNFSAVNLLGDHFDLATSGEALPSHPEGVSTSDLDHNGNIFAVLPSYERQKLSSVLATLQQRLFSAKTDMEDLIARLDQEFAMRQYLTTKVQDLEVEVETTKQSCQENMQQAVLIERERYTQTQWDVEEMRRQCLEVELKLKAAEDARVQAESAKASAVRESEMLLRQLDSTREQLANLNKRNEELEFKSKTDVKLLIKEVKSLRGAQSELKQDLTQLMKEKLEAEMLLQRERQKIAPAIAANTKLLHECEILRVRLQECSVNFLVEEENKLILDTSSPSDALDLLTTADNRIGLLLAEAQLLAEDVEAAVSSVEATHTNGSDTSTVDQLRKMLTDVLIDNATLQKQVNSVLRCALNTTVNSEKDEKDEEVPMRKTVLSKFLDR